MAKVEVKNIEFNDALKKFSHITSETKRSMRKHEYYLRPGLKAKEKSKEALKMMAKRKRKAHQ
ncbi:MAG: 30S ribosomal protein S21 [Mycoplasmataceae bacterium]|jgi:small subunit ribosomal protein S21|nr:30S ribosomal protein S21 [Mycoplasmataceae bacterium]